MRVADLLIKHEGLKLKPYRDTVGKLTIGVGRNLDDVGLSKEEALYLLRNDLESAQAALGREFSWYASLDSVRQAVLDNMAFNMGMTRLKGFRQMLTYVESKDYAKAADEMLDSRWAVQVGNRAKELAHMMKTGVWA